MAEATYLPDTVDDAWKRMSIYFRPLKWQKFIHGATKSKTNPRQIEVTTEFAWRPDNRRGGILMFSNSRKMADFDSIIFSITSGEPITAAGTTLPKGIGLLSYYEDENEKMNSKTPHIWGWFTLGDGNFDVLWSELSDISLIGLQITGVDPGLHARSFPPEADATWNISEDMRNDLPICTASFIAVIDTGRKQ
jgi:hypothetical protein